MTVPKSKKQITKSPFPILIRSPLQVGNAIRRLRRLKGFSQIKLANKSGLTQATISRIEKGNQKAEVSTLFLIFAALDADITINERIKSDTNSLEGLF